MWVIIISPYLISVDVISFNNSTEVFSLIVYTNYVIQVYFIAKITCLVTKE